MCTKYKKIYCNYFKGYKQILENQLVFRRCFCCNKQSISKAAPCQEHGFKNRIGLAGSTGERCLIRSGCLKKPEIWKK